MGLYDMAMLKDNHWEAYPGPKGRENPLGQPDIEKAVKRFRRAKPGVPVLVEAKTRREVDLALACRADIVLLDNMTTARLKGEIAHVRSRSPKTLIEVSGGVNLGNVGAIAKLGPDRISIGALTHSAPALDFSLEIGFKA